MRPKKKVIERARTNGSIDRLNQLLSAVHLLVCTANNYMEESSELLHENGLLLGELKKAFNNYVYSADRYFAEFGIMINGQESKMEMFKDIDEFDKYFRIYNKIEKEWTPKQQ